MRYRVPVGLKHTSALFLVAACQASTGDPTGFGAGADVTTASLGSTGEGSSTSGGLGTTSTGDGNGSGSGSAAMTTEPIRDLGTTPDFGDGAPAGCEGKIDLLFVISRDSNMQARQAQLALAFPQFIAAIQSKFVDFDYHVMVITGDDGWGNETCTEVCPNLACKVGDDCCPYNLADHQGEPCCTEPEYPCQDLDLVTKCDRTWGAGEVFPAGADGPANKPCPIDGDRRYLAKGQKDLPETFECIAKVGRSGHGALGQALTAAMQKPINDPGGCNRGFLRKDALLMVTFIDTNADQDDGPGSSEGVVQDWAQAVIEAKHGEDKSVVMFNIGNFNWPPHEGECHPEDRICLLTTMFPYHHQESIMVADYGPAFVEAASLVETACAGFVPPPG